MNTKPNCVKIEVLAECEGGKLSKSTWVEYYSPVYHHPYNTDTDRWLKVCDGDKALALLNPSVGESGHWLNDDISFVTDRMTCGISDRSGKDWSELRVTLADDIEDSLSTGEVRYCTLKGDDDNFTTFRITPLDRIPDIVPFDTKSDIPDYRGEIPEIVYEVLRNCVRRANGEPEQPLSKRIYRVEWRATCYAIVEVLASSREEARGIAERDGEPEWAAFSEDEAEIDTVELY